MRTWLTCAFGLLAALPLSAADAKRPNVPFLFTDDQRTDTIAAIGNPAIKTPTLDALAQPGFVFTNAYCQGSNVPAVCSPSRNMLLSGQLYFRFQGQAPADKANFPTSMKQTGYETYHHGKRGNTALAIQKLFDTDKYVMDEQDRKSGEPGQTIVDRNGSWKLIRYPLINKSQLFDLSKDPDELKNLADDPGQTDRVKELNALMREQQKLYGDKQELTSDKPKPAEVDLSFFKH